MMVIWESAAPRMASCGDAVAHGKPIVNWEPGSLVGPRWSRRAFRRCRRVGCQSKVVWGARLLEWLPVATPSHTGSRLYVGARKPPGSVVEIVELHEVVRTLDCQSGVV